jgi:hypothetical protein
MIGGDFDRPGVYLSDRGHALVFRIKGAAHVVAQDQPARPESSGEVPD